MLSRYSVALVQINIRDEEPADSRLQRGLNLIDSLDHPVSLVVFPELWTVGFFNFERYATSAEPLDGPTAARLSQAAARGAFWLHGGSIVERSADGRLYNTSLLFNPAGKLAAFYRKIHLFGIQSAEKSVLRAGEQVMSVESEIGKLGLTTCYDLRFPELYRALSARGTEVSLVSATWPSARLDHWLLLLRARAIENLCYVLACNTSGSCAGVALAGNSLIVDPWGKVLAQASDQECLLYAEVDLEAVARIRSHFPALEDRGGTWN